MTTVAHTPIEVNLNVEIEANGELNILGEPLRYPQNVIVATETLAAAALYAPAADCALIEFWEDSALNGIKAQLANDGGDGTPFVGFYKKSAKRLAEGLQAILVGQMNVKKGSMTNAYGESVPYSASPFNLTMYNSNSSLMENFGRVALGCYAHYIFGHAQATAAITNDVEFMRGMLSLDSSDEYVHADKVGDAGTNDPVDWVSLTGSETNADLARRLVGTLLANNLSAGAPVVSDQTEATASTKVVDIVKQVIGRDASRATDEDNNKYNVNKHGLLRFYAGDVVYVNIKLTKPVVNGSSGQQVADSTLEDLYASEENYSIRITLA
jgi:hypothetical protein